MKTLLMVLALAVLTGCAASKGFDRGALRSSAGPVTTDQAIEDVLALKPQLPAPFKLGVYLNSHSWIYKKRFWTDEEQNQLLAFGNQLKAAGIISDIYLISEDTVPGSNHWTFGSTANRELKDLRLAAARYGADAVLLITDVSAVDRYNNPAAFLYWTIIGAYVAPGTHSDALVMLRSSLWDVRNGYLYATQDAEGVAKKIGPALLLEDTASIDEAKKVAIADFGGKLTERLMRLNAAKPSP